MSSKLTNTAALLAALLLWQGSAQAFFCFSFGARGSGGGRSSSSTLPPPPPPGYFPIWAAPWVGAGATGWGNRPGPFAEPAVAPRQADATGDLRFRTTPNDRTGAGKPLAPATGQMGRDTGAPFDEYGPYRFRPGAPGAGNSIEF